MDTLESYTPKSFISATILTLIIGVGLIIASFMIGKDAFFLLLNKDLGETADNFFSFCTYMGNGFVWVILLVLFYVYRKDALPLFFAAVTFSTLITQGLKNFYVPVQLRPIAAIADISSIHTVKGVEILTNYSFPSGHTATAFSIFLVGCLMIREKWILPVGLLYALLVGYSRIYLAEHFPLDVGGGMITAVISVWLSVYIQQIWEKRRSNRKPHNIVQRTEEKNNINY